MNRTKYVTILLLLHRSEHRYDDSIRTHVYISADRVTPFVTLLNYLQQQFGAQSEMLAHIDISKSTYQRILQQSMSYQTGRKILNAYLDFKLRQVKR